MKRITRSMASALAALAVLYGSTTPAQAYTLNGSGGVSLGNATGNFGTHDFSITLSIQTNFQGNQAVFTKRSYDSQHILQLALYGSGAPVVEVRDDGPNPCCGYAFVGDGTQKLNDGSPHQLSLVRHGVDIALYVDGAVASGTTYVPWGNGTPFTLNLSSGTYEALDFVLGGYPQYPDWNFRGEINDFQVRIIYPNQPPVAVALASPTTVNVGELVTLDGRHSTDPEGDPLTYFWKPAIKLSAESFSQNENGTANFTPSEPGVYTFYLVVSDGQVYSTPAMVSVEVLRPNQPPVAVAGDDQTVNVGDTVTLDGSASYDPDAFKGSSLLYTWTQTSGPQPVKFQAHLVKKGFGSPASVTFSVFEAGVYTFSLVVNDGELDSEPSAVSVRVLSPNQPPVADAGPDQTLECTGPQTAVTLNGSGSLDPDGDALSYSWTAGGIEVSTEANPTFSLSKGSHTFVLTLADGNGASDDDEVVVNLVDTTPPIISLNGDAAMRVVYLSAYVETATATDLVDGVVTVTASGAVNTGAVGLYTLTYTATDASGNTGTATRTVEVFKTPVQLTGDVVAKIDGLVAGGSIPSGNGNAFQASLKAAITSINAGQTADAISELKAFINKVKAQSGKKITKALADQLIAAAQQIITQLGGTAKLVARGTTPTSFGLESNYPNPFNPATTLRYQLDEAREIRLSVYSVTGQLVKVLVEGTQGPGYYELQWDATDASGQQVAPGLYLYRLDSGSEAAMGKMLLLK